ncbi:MAG: N-formylglutamate deformylase [Alphaproteobacteria bacterium]
MSQAPSEPALYHVSEGTIPVLVNVPHAGVHIPPAIAATMTPAALAVADTDWFADRLAAVALAHGATLMTATHSRYVVDLNRDPTGTPLYPGADNTGLVPTTTFAHEPIYRDAPPDAAALAERVGRYWMPYHDQLYAELARMKVIHGIAVLLDVHSIPAHAPRFFDGRLPDLNLGSADGASAAPALTARAWRVCTEAKGFSAVHDGRFKGGYITRRYGQPEQGVHALQIEIVQAAYMTEGPPWVWDEAKARPLMAVLGAMVGTLADWVGHAAAA